MAIILYLDGESQQSGKSFFDIHRLPLPAHNIRDRWQFKYPWITFTTFTICILVVSFAYAMKKFLFLSLSRSFSLLLSVFPETNQRIKYSQSIQIQHSLTHNNFMPTYAYGKINKNHPRKYRKIKLASFVLISDTSDANIRFQSFHLLSVSHWNLLWHKYASWKINYRQSNVRKRMESFIEQYVQYSLHSKHGISIVHCSLFISHSSQYLHFISLQTNKYSR